MLQHLLLSKESKGRKGSDRGFISYAELGINQLGAVYEGLMSTGFFATEDLYEVAKNGDPEKGSWVVPVTRAEHLAAKSDFVTMLNEATGEQVPVIHRAGSFVYRLAAVNASSPPPTSPRKSWTSSLSPKHLRNCSTRTADAPPPTRSCNSPSASRLWVPERSPSRPCANSPPNTSNVSRKVGQVIDADQYQVAFAEGQGLPRPAPGVQWVDLNATAVELAEISLWLDTMVAGLQAPWFGLHLRRGNSLIGARRAVYAPTLLAKKAMAVHRTPRRATGRGHRSGYHFLLPSQGWGAVIDTAEAKTYAPENARNCGCGATVFAVIPAHRSRSVSRRWRSGSRRCGSSRCVA